MMKCAIALVLGLATVALGATLPGDVFLFTPHLVGGKQVRHMDAAYSVRLRLSKGDHLFTFRYCGAARLNDYWFVTAAECLDKEKYNIMAISYPEDINDGFQTKIATLSTYFEIYIHPKFNKATNENNIALIKFTMAGFVEDQKHVPLLPKKSEKDETFSSYKATVSGWTIDDPTAHEQKSDMIQVYETTMVNRALCKLVYFLRSVSNEHICASTWGGKRITEAHAGVPLVVSEPDSRLKLIGIASSIQPWTTKLPVPIVFTNVAQHAEWISETAGIRLRD